MHGGVAGRMRPRPSRRIAVDLTFLAHRDGGRRVPPQQPWGANGAWYMPHLVVQGGGDYLGVRLVAGPEVEPGLPQRFEFELMDEQVDDSALLAGVAFELVEGPLVVARGVVLGDVPVLRAEFSGRAYRAANGELAWRRADVVDVLEEIAATRQAVLGGEVWAIVDGTVHGVIPDRAGNRCVRGWDTGGRRGVEPWDVYCARTAEQSSRTIQAMNVEDEVDESFRDGLRFNLWYITEPDALGLWDRRP